jgi:uncharacterized DUF497 family protein
MSMTSERAFEWDDDKARSNLAKHGIPFQYATRVFLDLQLTAFDASRAGIMKSDARRSG